MPRLSACAARAHCQRAFRCAYQGPWRPPLLKPAKGWSADPVTRYADGAIIRTRSNYTNVASKRLFRGAGATPARIRALDIKAEAGSNFL